MGRPRPSGHSRGTIHAWWGPIRCPVGPCARARSSGRLRGGSPASLPFRPRHRAGAVSERAGERGGLRRAPQGPQLALGLAPPHRGSAPGPGKDGGVFSCVCHGSASSSVGCVLHVCRRCRTMPAPEGDGSGRGARSGTFPTFDAIRSVQFDCIVPTASSRLHRPDCIVSTASSRLHRPDCTEGSGRRLVSTDHRWNGDGDVERVDVGGVRSGPASQPIGLTTARLVRGPAYCGCPNHTRNGRVPGSRACWSAQPAGTFQPRDSAISLQVGQIG